MRWMIVCPSGWLVAVLMTVLALLPTQASWADQHLTSGDIDITVQELDGDAFVTNIDYVFQRLKVTNNKALPATLTFSPLINGQVGSPPFPQLSVLILEPGGSNNVFLYTDNANDATE